MYSKFIQKLFYITEKHVTYVINTKPHTCFNIARQIVLVRYEEGFNSTSGLVVSFLITNSCNLSCCIKTSVWFCTFTHLTGTDPRSSLKTVKPSLCNTDPHIFKNDLIEWNILDFAEFPELYRPFCLVTSNIIVKKGEGHEIYPTCGISARADIK